MSKFSTYNFYFYYKDTDDIYIHVPNILFEIDTQQHK